jgi:pimeloyl-ACP methyl ester carboxylesterase
MPRILALSAVVSVVLALPTFGGSPAEAAEAVVSIPVSFEVVNQNRSAAQCPADGARYTVRGHLTGPASVLRRDIVRAATLYLHGNAVDERIWRYTKTEGYNHVAEMARAGFVSVSIDRLGYGASDAPPGKENCFGDEADVAHQIVGQLRSGSYRSGGPHPKVGRLALVGHSAAGFVAMAEAYSFRDVDALVVVASGEFATPRVVEVVADQQRRCLDSDHGYEPIYTDEAAFGRDFFFDAEPQIVADVAGARIADSCGGTSFAAADVTADLAMLATIGVPVLTIAGARDSFFPHPDLQAKLFTGSPDVQTVKLDGMGHGIVLERKAPAFRAALAGWLRDRRFAAR